MYQIIYTDRYVRQAKRFFEKHPDLLTRYEKTLIMLEANPYHPALRLHKLTGQLDGINSVSINIKYRITIELLIQDQKIIPITIGTHDTAY